MKVKIDDDEVDCVVYRALKRSLKFLEEDDDWSHDGEADERLMAAMRLLIKYYGPPDFPG